MTRTITLFFALTILLAASASAFDAGAVRRATERGANWLILQFDLNQKTFGSIKAPEQLAMAVKALCDNPRDYKEASGPFITEPLKNILGKINDSGHVDGVAINEAEAIQWIITGLKSTKNEKYAPVIEKLRARVAELGKPDYPKFEAAHLKPAAATPDAMRNAIAGVLRAAESGKKEIDVDGQQVKWAEVLGESLANLQKPDGSFNEDAQTTAMALYALNLCVKAL